MPENPLSATVPEHNRLVHVHGVSAVWRLAQKIGNVFCHRCTTTLHPPSKRAYYPSTYMYTTCSLCIASASRRRFTTHNLVEYLGRESFEGDSVPLMVKTDRDSGLPRHDEHDGPVCAGSRFNTKPRHPHNLARSPPTLVSSDIKPVLPQPARSVERVLILAQITAQTS